MSDIKEKILGRDSNGNWLLSIVYENNFIQLYPIPKKEINKVIREFLEEKMKWLYNMIDLKKMPFRSPLQVYQALNYFKKELDGEE